jgi:predicted RNA-binding protein
MCLAKVYIKQNKIEKFLLENVTQLEIADKTLIFTTVFKETKKVEANIKRIDFENANIILETGS